MTAPNLDALITLTRDYAVFQARKSGLATALGGLMAVLLVGEPVRPSNVAALALVVGGIIIAERFGVRPQAA